jgi:phage tail sheath protein FI
MNLNFGINGSISVAAARPITVSSTTAIGVLSVATKEYGLHKFNNAEAGLTFLAEKKITGDIVSALKAINLQGVNCPIIVNLCSADKTLEAIDLFSKSEALTGVSLFGGVMIAPVLSAELQVATKLDAVATKLWATAFIDNFGKDEAEVMKFVKNFGSKNSVITFGKYTADGVEVSASSLYAGTTARWDAAPFGWAKSHSNRSVKGVSAASRPIEYLDGSECEARRMRQAGVACIVADIGWRTYGFETTDIDPIWQSLDRVRAFARILQAISIASKWARDREASELLWVKQSVVEFMNELKGNDVVIGFEVFFDPEKNTKATVTAGKFYLTIKMSDMPSVRELNIELVYSDDYNDVLINYINGE